MLYSPVVTSNYLIVIQLYHRLSWNTQQVSELYRTIMCTMYIVQQVYSYILLEYFKVLPFLVFLGISGIHYSHPTN